jgi:hypothetical protein
MGCGPSHPSGPPSAGPQYTECIDSSFDPFSLRDDEIEEWPTRPKVREVPDIFQSEDWVVTSDLLPESCETPYCFFPPKQDLCTVIEGDRAAQGPTPMVYSQIKERQSCQGGDWETADLTRPSAYVFPEGKSCGRLFSGDGVIVITIHTETNGFVSRNRLYDTITYYLKPFRWGSSPMVTTAAYVTYPSSTGRQRDLKPFRERMSAEDIYLKGIPVHIPPTDSGFDVTILIKPDSLTPGDQWYFMHVQTFLWVGDSPADDHQAGGPTDIPGVTRQCLTTSTCCTVGTGDGVSP